MSSPRVKKVFWSSDCKFLITRSKHKSPLRRSKGLTVEGTGYDLTTAGQQRRSAKPGRFALARSETLPKQKVEGLYRHGPECWKFPKYPGLSAVGCGARERLWEQTLRRGVRCERTGAANLSICRASGARPRGHWERGGGAGPEGRLRVT